MKPYPFTLRELQYLTALADEQHMGRAAARCFVSQPTMSAQLKRLEQQLDIALFERAPKTLRLSEAGQAIAAQAAELLRTASQLQETAEYFHDPFFGPLKVGVIPTIGPYLLPPLVARCNAELPKTNIIWHEAQTHELVALLNQGELDVAVLAFPVELQGLASQDLYSEPFMALLPPEHELLVKSQVSLSELNDYDVLLLNEGHCLRDHALAVCEQRVSQQLPNTRATSLETLRSLVHSGYGLSLFPQSAILPSDNSRPISSVNAQRRVGVAYRPGSAKLDVIQVFSECVTNSASKW